MKLNGGIYMFELIPFSQQERNLINFFNNFEDSFFKGLSTGTAHFRTDIVDKGDNYLIMAELPGFKREEININVENGVLSINAENHTGSNDLRCRHHIVHIIADMVGSAMPHIFPDFIHGKSKSPCGDPLSFLVIEVDSTGVVAVDDRFISQCDPLVNKVVGQGTGTDFTDFRFVGSEISQQADQDINKYDEKHDQPDIEPEGAPVLNNAWRFVFI